MATETIMYIGVDDRRRVTFTEPDPDDPDELIPLDTTGYIVTADIVEVPDGDESLSDTEAVAHITSDGADPGITPVDAAEGIWEMHFPRDVLADVPAGRYRFYITLYEPGYPATGDRVPALKGLCEVEPWPPEVAP